MKTLGIDPGTAITGYGILDDRNGTVKVIDYGCVKTSSKESPSKRLSKIYADVKKLISKHKPKYVAIEKLFFNSNVKTAMAVGQARGVMILAASEAGLSISEYTPLEVKMALTGYGRADKTQMQKMVKTLLRLDEIPRPDDAADALAIALCHVNSKSFKQKVGELN
ncbi:crossover junction endodeoxyribonuclease RuvC [Candidatus Margulisiibacteriota bacterium]